MAQGLPFHETIPRAFSDLAEWMMKKNIPFSAGKPAGLAIYFDDPKSVEPSQMRFKVAMPVVQSTPLSAEGRAAVENLPGCKAATLRFTGPFDSLEQKYQRLAAWVMGNGYQFADAPREVYVRWGEEIPPEEWITEIQFPVIG
jgi:AraC family transcriptional regulator